MKGKGFVKETEKNTRSFPIVTILSNISSTTALKSNFRRLSLSPKFCVSHGQICFHLSEKEQIQILFFHFTGEI